MFRLPIAQAFRLSAAHRPHSLISALSIPRTRTFRSSPPCPSRFIPTQCTRIQVAEIPASFSRAFFRPSDNIPRRPFASFGRRYYSNGNRYRRFDGPRGEPIVMRLVRNAKPHHFVIIGGVIGGFYVYNTETVEMTGRRRFNCVSHNQELKMGQESYNEVLQQSRGHILPDSHPLTIMVNRVLQRLIPVAPIHDADWKVHVIHDDNMKNAFVLPGGKVFVYTGILPICQDEDGLAAVLGHEIAHVVARHPAERMSNNFVTMGVVLLTAFLFDISGQIPGLLLNLMYSLPNSRTQEAEADNIGLMMMSKACFNPEAAVGLWERMHKAEQISPPQFMSTHPTSYNRMEAIRGWLDKAQVVYEDSGCFSIGNYMPGFQRARDDFDW